MFFFQILGQKLPYDSLSEIRCRLEEVSPNLTKYGDAEDSNYFAQAAELAKVQFSETILKLFVQRMDRIFWLSFLCRLKWN